jgi:AraC-like DNA-binding protein
MLPRVRPMSRSRCSVLTMLHQQPSHPWTVAELATKVGASRSVIAERFVQSSENRRSPLSRAGACSSRRDCCRPPPKTILHVAFDVGYESEAAFNRAFKREFGLPPAQYRRKLAAS